MRKPVSGVRAGLVEDAYIIPVTGDGDEEVEAEATQGGDGVSQETPIEAATDEGKTSGSGIDFTEAVKKYEQDINKIKSVFQKKETDLLKEKSALERKLDDLLKSTMDDDSRKIYEQEKLQEELSSIRQERDALRMESENIKQFFMWREYFLDAGIPSSKLSVDEGLPGLFNSGMAAMREKIKNLESAKPATSAQPQKPGIKPPEVAQSTTGKVATIGSLSEAVKHFADGDEERFWRMAETGNANVLKVLNELSEN